MSDPAPARRKLPPLGQTGSDVGSLDRTPRKKKKKRPPATGDSPDGETHSPGRALPKPGSARSLTESESNLETARSGRVIPSRPKSKKTRPSVNTDTLEDIEDEDESPRPQKKRTKPRVSSKFEIFN